MSERIATKLTDNKFLNIYNVVDPSKGVKGYQFAERRGVDSVAFICIDSNVHNKKTSNPTKYLLNKEYTPPTDEFHFRAFGGSFDKNKTAIEIVRDEVKEECGYVVGKEQIVSLGRVFVSTQMNQYCHLFMVLVDSSVTPQREPENAVEALATPTWLTYEEIVGGSDWKAISIIAKFFNETR